MKKNLSKIMLVAFAGIAMLGMTSCNADEPENELTPAEAQAAYESVKGEYTGYVFFKKRKSNRRSWSHRPKMQHRLYA